MDDVERTVHNLHIMNYVSLCARCETVSDFFEGICNEWCVGGRFVQIG